MILNSKKEPPNNGTSYIKKLIDASYQGLKRLLLFAYDGRINVNDRVRVHSRTKS